VRLDAGIRPEQADCYQETVDGGLILPRGMLDTATSLAAQAGSRLDITDRRSPGTAQDITCSLCASTSTRRPPAASPRSSSALTAGAPAPAAATAPSSFVTRSTSRRRYPSWQFN
jgi:hypothetical protein